MNKLIKKRIVILGLFCIPVMAMAGTDPSPRNTVSLDGVWEIAEGVMDQVPEKFERQIPVPGLVSLAQPPFVYGPASKQRDAYWYRRTFTLDEPIPEIVRLKVSKAMFGTRVLLNGRVIGDHSPSFTPGYFDLNEKTGAYQIKGSLRAGTNELLIRVGASRECLERTMPAGHDSEKNRYIPGIFDSVELILTGTPFIRNVQAAPDIQNKSVRVQAVVYSADEGDKGSLKFTVREKISGAVVGTGEAPLKALIAGTDNVIDVTIPVANCRLWSPEDPFLYDLSVESAADRFDTRFGMREFRFDSATGRAMLNGKPYFMRGSNITLYRFFEDSECKELPWNEQWVRDLHLSFKKQFHWNSLRYSLGFPPEKWYQVADEVGILIQDEFPYWSMWDLNRPTTVELVREYTEWMQERWNHPSVVVWDAQNESPVKTTGPAIRQVRSLDLSNRPWDNGLGHPDAPSDPIESHPYHFNNNTKFSLKDMPTQSPVPPFGWAGYSGEKPKEPHAIIVNEYGGLWLRRDGFPTYLTKKSYDRLLGTNSTAEQRFHFYARTMAAVTEFWRCHRKCAGVLLFSALSYSHKDGATSDQFTDVAKLVYNSEFLKYVPDSFAPVGLMVDYWNDKAEVGSPVKIPIIAINDLDEPWSGPVTLRIVDGDKIVSETSQPSAMEAYGQTNMMFEISFPAQPGKYTIQAELQGAGGHPVKSLRDIEVMSHEEFKNAAEAGTPPDSPK